MTCVLCGGSGTAFDRTCIVCGGTGAMAGSGSAFGDEGSRRTTPEDSVLAVRRHVERIFGPRSDDSPLADDDDLATLTDTELALREVRLDRRLLAERARLVSNPADPDAVAALEALIDGYGRLAAVRQGPAAAGARRSLADATGLLGAVLARLNQIEAAERAYRRAQELWTALGEHDRAASVADDLRVLRASRERDYDAELIRLATALADAPTTLEFADVQLQLAELHLDAGDSFEATTWFERAEQTLAPYADRLGGAATARALITSMSAVLGGEHVAGSSPIEEAVTVRMLHKRLYLGLGQAKRLSDPAGAERYLALLHDLDGTLEEGDRDNADFSRMMHEFLHDLGNADPPR